MVQRLKFKIPPLELTQLADFYKNEITTTPVYKTVHLIKEGSFIIGGKTSESYHIQFWKMMKKLVSF